MSEHQRAVEEILARSKAEGLIGRPPSAPGSSHRPRLPIMLGECVRHGWHGKTVCPACRETGQVVLPIRVLASGPRRYRMISVSQSLLRFRGGGREKVRQEARCRMCERSRGPDTQKEWLQGVAGGKVFELGSRSLTRHHLTPQWWFKGQPPPTRAIRSVDANIVPLCRPCHDEVEREEGGRRMLRRVLGAEEIALILQLAGEDWFEERYPKP